MILRNKIVLHTEVASNQYKVKIVFFYLNIAPILRETSVI